MGKSLRTTSSSGSKPSITFSFDVTRFGDGRRAPFSTADSGPDVLVVALGLELLGQLRAALLGHPAVDEHVHVVRLDVAQDPRVVRDQQDALALLGAEPVDAVRDHLERVDVEA